MPSKFAKEKLPSKPLIGRFVVEHLSRHSEGCPKCKTLISVLFSFKLRVGIHVVVQISLHVDSNHIFLPELNDVYSTFIQPFEEKIGIELDPCDIQKE